MALVVLVPLAGPGGTGPTAYQARLRFQACRQDPGLQNGDMLRIADAGAGVIGGSVMARQHGSGTGDDVHRHAAQLVPDRDCLVGVAGRDGAEAAVPGDQRLRGPHPGVLEDRGSGMAGNGAASGSAARSPTGPLRLIQATAA